MCWAVVINPFNSLNREEDFILRLEWVDILHHVAMVHSSWEPEGSAVETEDETQRSLTSMEAALWVW